VFGRAMHLVVLVASACSSNGPSPGGRVEIVEAPASGDLAAYVVSELARGSRDHVPVLVYVGATWCEPCRQLHAAATSGSLDGSLGPLRLLELDLDRDESRLEAAGYHSDFVPLIARPGPDGHASGVQTDGVKQGRDYVEQLTPRIRGLIDRP